MMPIVSLHVLCRVLYRVYGYVYVYSPVHLPKIV
jgi:hypothetical protein